VHLEHHELREAAIRLKEANAALGAHPDRLIQTVASLTAACGALAEGHAGLAAHITARARAGWPIPAWLEQRLSLVESRACAAAGDIQAALAAAERATRDNSPEAAVTLAHAWLAAGDSGNARRALAPALAAHSGTPERVRLQVWLADARLNYNTGDSARGRRSLASALRLAGREQLRLPFAVERGWLGPTLRRDSGLADIYRRLFAPGLCRDQLPAPPAVQNQATTLAAQPLTEREREVLRHFSNMLSSAEVATEMLISINTVNTHLKHILRKLAASRRGEAVRRARQLGLI
jgi:LuxR family maltose regulon positive regulatory protein